MGFIIDKSQVLYLLIIKCCLKFSLLRNDQTLEPMESVSDHH